jgi:hypothetical protein
MLSVNPRSMLDCSRETDPCRDIPRERSCEPTSFLNRVNRLWLLYGPLISLWGIFLRSLKGSKPPASAVRRMAGGPAQGIAKRRPGEQVHTKRPSPERAQHWLRQRFVPPFQGSFQKRPPPRAALRSALGCAAPKGPLRALQARPRTTSLSLSTGHWLLYGEFWGISVACRAQPRIIAPPKDSTEGFGEVQTL